MYFSIYKSPVGDITMLSADGRSLAALRIDGQSDYAELISGGEHKELELFREVGAWLDRYFAGERAEQPNISVNAVGSPFRQRVWELTRRIPYGKTMTYGEIAEIIAAERGVDKVSAQAVGGAVGHNPISIIIPCHRVIGANNNLVGYGGGIELKKRLLAIEGFDLSKFRDPKRK